MNSNLKSKIEYCGLNYKTEKMKITLFNILLFAINGIQYFLLKNLTYIILVGLCQLVIDYLLISSYSSKSRILENEREDEFVTIISYLEVFLTNKNNVYQSFNKIIPYASDWMKDIISNFLKEIDKDKTVQPFVNFANNFKMKIATNIMLSIFSMVDQGETREQINQFQLLFEQLFKSKQIEKLDKKKRSLSGLASLPLVGAAGITIMLTISIISVIGELVNVI